MVSTPSPPNPNEVAAAQSAANRSAAQAASISNNFNEVGPYGTVNYTPGSVEYITELNKKGREKEVPVTRYNRTVTLNPEQQTLLDQQNELGQGLNQFAINQVGRLDETLSDPFSLDEISGDRVTQAILDRMAPRREDRRSSLNAELAARGVLPGSEAYNRDIDELNRANTDAELGAILAGGQEQSRLAQLAFAERNQPINEISALMSGGQATIPQFTSPYQQPIQPAPIGDYMYDSYNMQAQNAAAQNAGLFGLAGTVTKGVMGMPFMQFSDERLKKDIKKVGKTDDGLNVYTYKYKGDETPQMGVMAQEVAKKNPSAVGVHASGFLGVDYSKVA